MFASQERRVFSKEGVDRQESNGERDTAAKHKPPFSIIVHLFLIGNALPENNTKLDGGLFTLNFQPCSAMNVLFHPSNAMINLNC